MRKSMLSLGSILVLFVLVSISFQPIIAENQIKEIEKTKLLNNLLTELDNIYFNLIESQNEKSSCNCQIKTSDFDPIILCVILNFISGMLIILALLCDEFNLDLLENLFLKIESPIGKLWEILCVNYKDVI